MLLPWSSYRCRCPECCSASLRPSPDRSFAAHDGAEVNVHVVLHVLISTGICRDLQDGDDGVAGAGAAARGEDDCVAACSDHRGDRGNIIASGVHNDCAALRGRNSLFQNLDDGTGAALADAAQALLVQSGQAACLVAGVG